MKDKVEGIKIEKSVVIRRTPEALYRFWRNFENLPRIMSHLKKVTMTHGKRSHWEAKGPAGTTFEWDAELISDKENEMISWRALERADVPNTGSVHFTSKDAGAATEVRVMIQYDPPAGRLGAAIANLFGEEPSQQVEEDLRRFKEVMEMGSETSSKSRVA